MSSQAPLNNIVFDQAAIYDFRVVDDRDAVMSEVKLELFHPKDVLVMAMIVANEIRLSHPNLDCRDWAVEITEPSGRPFTSLQFSSIALYAPSSARDRPHCADDRHRPAEGLDDFREPVAEHVIH